jgi:hypothetical protein
MNRHFEIPQGVAELDGVSVCERDVLELDAGPGRQIRGRAAALD